jgi:hypothetical protein
MVISFDKIHTYMLAIDKIFCSVIFDVVCRILFICSQFYYV